MALELYPHQERGVELFCKNPFFANFGEPGCGKTAQAIVAADRLKIRRMLVICPASLVLNWEAEFKLWSTRFITFPLTGSAVKRIEMARTALAQAQSGRAVAVITNYESVQFKASKEEIALARKQRRAPRCEKELVNVLTGAWGVVVADELHRVKCHKSQTFKGLKQIGSKALRRWGLTGTPMANNILDYWAQIDWIKPGHLNPNYYSFRAEHADIYTGAGFPKILRFKNDVSLKRRVDEISYRVTKAEAVKLPPKIKKVIPIEMSPAAFKVYKQMVDEMVVELEGKEIIASTALVKMLRLQQITSGYIGSDDGKIREVGTDKMDVLKDLMSDFENEHTIIMSRFAEDMPRLRAMLKDFDVVEISGRVSKEDRRAAEMRFKEEKPCVMIATIQAAGTGLNLVKSNKIIYYSRDFSYVNAVQSQDRIDRIGQAAEKIYYYDLCCRKTIDEYASEVFMRKKKIADKITGDEFRAIALGEVE